MEGRTNRLKPFKPFPTTSKSRNHPNKAARIGEEKKININLQNLISLYNGLKKRKEKKKKEATFQAITVPETIIWTFSKRHPGF